jgi:sugar lactone lactonase YvrE
MRNVFAFALLLVAIPSLAQEYVIHTFAGGAPLPTPVAAIHAPVPNAAGMALDAAGNLYLVADSCVFVISPTGVMNRIAGNARPGFSGDGGPALNAQFDVPLGLALDSSGNIYVADSLNHRIRMISAADGTITTVAGNGTAGYTKDGVAASTSEINGPTAVTLDAKGNLYIADTGNNRVRKVSGGVITTVAGTGVVGYTGDNGPATSATLNAPSGLAVDDEGFLYISDTKNYVVRKIGQHGIITTFAGDGGKGGQDLKAGSPATSVGLAAVQGLAFDAAGNLYISDPSNGLDVVKNGLISPAQAFSSTGFLAVDPSGNIYGENYNYGIYKYAPDGTSTSVAGEGLFSTPGYSGDGGPAVNAHFSGPQGVALDAAGDLYIADTGDSLVRKVDTTGTMSTFDPLGGIRGYTYAQIEGETTISSPVALTFDGTGNLFVADFSDLRHVTPKGVVTVWAPYTSIPTMQGIGPVAGLAFNVSGNLYVTVPGYIRISTPADAWSISAGIGVPGYGRDNVGAITTPVDYPAGIAIDAYDNYYFADKESHRIRKVSGGMVTTVAGTGLPGFSGDGGPATSAELNFPMSVALDSAGNLYIADTGNNRIRKVSTAGVIATIAGTGAAGYSGDGGPAILAQLNTPSNLQLDPSGNIYIADTTNNAIRELSVIAPLVMAPATLPNATAGIPYSATLSATGGALPYTWTVPIGTLPDGLGISNSGTISGTPAVPQTSTFTIAVTDAGKSTVSQSFRVVVVLPVAIIEKALAQGTVGTPYSQSLAAAGGTLPYSWSLSASALPAGLTLSAAGVITGTPTAAGTFTFTAQVTDANALTATQAFMIVVIAPPAIAAAALPVATVGAPYSQTLTTSGGTPPFTWSIAAGTLPAGLSLSSAGLIAGTPSATGASAFTVQVTDSNSLTSTQTFTIQVVNPTLLPAAVTGLAYSQTIATAEETPAAALSLASGTLPPGLAVSAPNVIGGTPTAAGSFVFTLSITDGSGLTVSQTFQLTVIDATTLARAAVLPQLLAAATTFVLTNNTNSPVAVQLVPHADDGSLAAGSPLAASLAPNAVFTQQLTGPGWVDILASSPPAGTATSAQGQTIPLQTQFESEVDVPYDNTGSAVPAVSLVNLSANPAIITATVFDTTGAQLDVEQVALPAYGHTSFTLAAQLTATAGGQGLVKFQNPSGGHLAGLIVLTAADGTLSFNPVTLP